MKSLIENKRGIELSVNFIVMLVLSILVLSFGVFFVNKIFFSADDFREHVDRQTEAEINALLNDGSRFAIPFTRQEAKRNDMAYFGVGILNVLGPNRLFDIGVVSELSYDANGNEIANADTHVGVLYSRDAISIDNNKQELRQIGIKPNGEAVKGGTYVFTVYCCSAEFITCDNSVPTQDIYASKRIYLTVI